MSAILNRRTLIANGLSSPSRGILGRQNAVREFPGDRDVSSAPTPYTGAAMKITMSALTLIGATTIGVLSACGSQPAQARAETPAQIWHELVACARSHGMPNLPDPTIDSQGGAQFPPSVPAPPQSVRQACQSIYDRLPASVRNDSAAAPNIAMETRFAQCMRTHGLSDFPDPNADGSYSLTRPQAGAAKRLQLGLGAGELGPVYYSFQAAWDACRAFNSTGSINVSHP